MTLEGITEPVKYDVEVEYRGTMSQNTFLIFMDDESVESFFDLEGPNEIIFLIAAVFIVMLGPIIAIALSFDSVTREKLQKSLDFLLARPMGRRGIIVGKFLGILSAIVLPVTAINLLAVWIISSITGKNPSGALVAGFILYTIILLAIFILIQQIFSTLAKTTGTAILSGIAIWLIFFMFWGLLTLAIGAAAGMQFNSDEWIILSNRMSLFNPSGAYSTAMALLLPDSTGALGIESWMPPAAMIIWLVIMFFLATEIFVRKADK
jgi:ABC-type transport system involved in multi-copper enzyme maturation permease subunit